MLYTCAKASRRVMENQTLNEALRRREKLLRDNDDLNIWKAINWKGEYNDRKESDCVGTDEELKQYLENTLDSLDNPSSDLNDFVTDTTIPIPDEAMTPYKVQNQVKLLKSTKASVPDGLPPGTLKMLPPQWILMITNVFNYFPFRCLP